MLKTTTVNQCSMTIFVVSPLVIYCQKFMSCCLLEKCFGKFIKSSESQFVFKKGNGCNNAVYSM